jgi:hypothetical protein
MRERGVRVEEEQVLPDLISDLRTEPRVAACG